MNRKWVARAAVVVLMVASSGGSVLPVAASEPTPETVQGPSALEASAGLFASAQVSNCPDDASDIDQEQDSDFEQFNATVAAATSCDEGAANSEASGGASQTTTIDTSAAIETVSSVAEGDASARNVEGGRFVSASGDGRLTISFSGPASFTLTGQIASSGSLDPDEGVGKGCVILELFVGERIRRVAGTNHDGRCLAISIPRNTPPSRTINESGSVPEGDFTLNLFGRTEALRGESKPAGTSDGGFTWDIDFTVEPACPASIAAPMTPGEGGEPAADQCPTPTGHILFTRPGFRGRDVIFVMSADGSNPSVPLPLTSDNEGASRDPAWDSDGKRMAFMDPGFGSLRSMTAGGSDEAVVPDGDLDPRLDGGAPEVAPDGRRVAYECGPGICLAGAGGAVRLVASGSNPAWSPGGQKIVYDRLRQGDRDIFSVNANGTGSPVALTDTEGADTDPDFAPGGQIVFVSTRDGNPELYRMRSVPGSEPERLTDSPGFDGAPTLSPDGNFVAFLSARDGNRDIFVMPLQGGPPANLTDSPQPEADPDWGQSACTFYGTAGNDTPSPRAGHLCGGPGNDTLTGAGGTDTLDGGPGRDTLDGKGSGDDIFGGDERVVGDEIDDRIRGGEGFDTIFAGTGNDRIVGGGGDDEIFGGFGDDDIEGDGATPNPGFDQIRGESGNDDIGGGPRDDVIHGEEDGDTIDGDQGEDTVRGGPDRDVFTACDGIQDRIFGGPGNQSGDSQDEATFDQGIDVLNSVEVRTPC